MIRPEEQHARDLHRALSSALAADPAALATVTGGGVQWKCAATRGDRACMVCCFDARGPEYLAAFDAADNTEAWGRTSSREDTAAAAKRWLAGAGVADLHAAFAFVDREKRALVGLADAVVRSRPALRAAAVEVRHQMCDMNELCVTSSDRACEVSYYGKNPTPDASFQWDGCELFRFRVDDPMSFGAVLERWLIDRAMPSAMSASFPWLRLDAVARYYEEGRPVEGEFLASWDGIERFYRGLDWPFAGAVHALVADIRRAGYDRVLRAGQSLWSLVVSRSRRHGLRADQPSIAFEFGKAGMNLYVNIGDVERCPVPVIALTPDVEALLRRLVSVAID